MEKNKKIILAVIIVVIIAIIGCALYVVGFGSVSGETPFSNDFMAGDFKGTVNVVDNSDKWAVAYKDPVHHIEYNMSTCKNASFLIDLYKLQGMKGPELKHYNGQEWNIITGQGVSQVGNTSSASDKTLYVYMCVADKDDQSYVIYIIFTNSTEVNVDGSLFCDGYKQFIEPLLSSIELKHNSNVPSLAELLGMDENSFDAQAFLVNQASKGNQSAIAALSGE